MRFDRPHCAWRPFVEDSPEASPWAHENRVRDQYSGIVCDVTIFRDEAYIETSGKQAGYPYPVMIAPQRRWLGSKGEQLAHLALVIIGTLGRCGASYLADI